MAKRNVKEKVKAFTHGGAPAFAHQTPQAMLERAIMSCMLWEDTFYESGVSIAERIKELCAKVPVRDICALAVRAREEGKLRHAPLLLLSEAARYAGTVKLEQDEVHPLRVATARVLQRADEPAELLAIYFGGADRLQSGRKLANSIKKGIADAFAKFNEYGFAKYDRDGAFKLRDVMFLTHPKPIDDERVALYKRIADRTLVTPDTWEVALSAGSDKKEVFTRLLTEEKLGYDALLKNLRNMVQSGVDSALVRVGLLKRKGAQRTLPFRYIAAAKHAPQYEPELDAALQASLAEAEKLPGKTVIIVDVSGSMNAPLSGLLSGKSELTRKDAASALAAVAVGICEDARVYATAGDDWRRKHATVFLPKRNGMAMIEKIKSSNSEVGMGGIFTQQVLDFCLEAEGDADRIICITDEQDCSSYDASPSKAKPFGKRNYLVNVNSYKDGVNYGQWVQINGFSEHVLAFIRAYENFENQALNS